MFLGYQNNKIVAVAQTREALEKLPCLVFDRIEETAEEYVLLNGLYLVKSEASKREAKAARLARIDELKGLLSASDYRAIKYAEGVLSEEEFAESKAQRQVWRDEVNALLEDAV